MNPFGNPNTVPMLSVPLMHDRANAEKMNVPVESFYPGTILDLWVEGKMTQLLLVVIYWAHKWVSEAFMESPSNLKIDSDEFGRFCAITERWTALELLEVLQPELKECNTIPPEEKHELLVITSTTGYILAQPEAFLKYRAQYPEKAISHYLDVDEEEKNAQDLARFLRQNMDTVGNVGYFDPTIIDA